MKAHFRFAGTEKSPQSQKSCRDAEIFVFTMGGLSQRMDIAKKKGGVTATGQIAQTCVFSAAARAATSRATDRTKRPPGLAGSGWAAARVQRGLPLIGRSGALGLVSSDGAAPLGLEPTGGGGPWVWLA